jgi:hypothetical protein
MSRTLWIENGLEPTYFNSVPLFVNDINVNVTTHDDFKTRTVNGVRVGVGVGVGAEGAASVIP